MQDRRKTRSDWQACLRPEDIAVAEEFTERSAHWSKLSLSRQASQQRIYEDLQVYADSPFSPSCIVVMDSLWQRPDLAELLTSFLTHKTRHTKPSPKRQSEGQTHIHWSTLNDWVQLLVGLTRTHAKSVANDIAPRLAQHRGFLSEQLDLERHIGDKLYFGRGETQLLLEHLLGKGEEPEWTLQCYVNWLIMFLTGARPSALGPYYPAWVKQGKFLKLKDFRIYVEGPATWRIELFFRVIKGFNKDKEGKTVKIICRPTQMWENVVFDLGPPLLSLLLKRGALADISTLEELLAYDKTEIHIRSEHLEQPLFYAGISKGAGVSRTPQGPGSMSAVIKRHCMDVGFVGGSSYPFRRAGAQTIHDQYGLSATKGYLSHQPNTNTAENSYLLGSATLDVVGANTGEALISTNDLNMFTAPSLGPGAGLRPDAQARLDRLTTGHKPFRSCDPAQQETHRRTEETRKLKDGTRIPLSVFISYMKRARRDPDYLAYVQSEACAATEREMVQLKADVEDMVGKVQSGGSATNVPGRIASSKATRAQKDTATENWKKYTKLQTQVVSRRTSKAVKVLQRLYYLDHPKDVADTNATPIATVSSSSGPVTSSTGKPLQTIAEFEERRKKRAAPSQLAQAAVDLASKTSGSGLPEHDEEQPLADLHMGDFIDMGSDMPPFALSRDVNGRLELCRDAALEEPGAKIDEDTSKDMSAVRAGYVRLLMSLKKADNTNELRCELCPIDPTAEAARLGETYNARGLLRHQENYHHIPAQCDRWFKLGHRMERGMVQSRTVGTCFLCYSNGERHLKKFKTSQRHSFHIFRPNPSHSDEPHHAMDPRLNDPHWTGVVQKHRAVVTPGWVHVVRTHDRDAVSRADVLNHTNLSRLMQALPSIPIAAHRTPAHGHPISVEVDTLRLGRLVRSIVSRPA